MTAVPRRSPTLISDAPSAVTETSPAPTPVAVVETTPPRAGWLGRLSRLAVLSPTSPVGTILGVVLIAAGFGLIAIAWSEIAAQTDVAFQLPYLVSAGITGLALVIIGVLIINLSVKRQDAAERRQQMSQLADLLADVKQSLNR